MNEQHERVLLEGLRALAHSTRDQAASAQVEAAVLARMAATGGTAHTATVSSSGRWFSLAAAAALLVVSASGAWLASRAERQQSGGIRPSGFVEIPGASVLPPLETGSIIRVALPVGALPQYGLAIPGDVVSGQVDAEMLVAQDGVPRAIRLVGTETTRSSAP